MQKQDKLWRLVKAYEDHLAEYQQSSYNETELRNDFINPFFEILGWDVMNQKNLPQHLREVKHEASVYVEERGSRRIKKPDYAFHLGTEACFYLETKKPSVDIMNSRESVRQLRRYGWNGNLLVSVLTNFTDLLIYDCSIRPKDDEDITQALLAHYHYAEYVEKLPEISEMLSRESVLSGKFAKTFSSLSSPVKKEPFTMYFLAQIRKWRLALGEDIHRNNRTLDEEELNSCVQKLINRIIFLRICEDRSLEPYENLKMASGYQDLKRMFAQADRKYDSGLFDLWDGRELLVSDGVLTEMISELYYPNSCYEFSVVDPYIIGQIYELFLEEKLAFTSGNSGKEDSLREKGNLGESQEKLEPQVKEKTRQDFPAQMAARLEQEEGGQLVLPGFSMEAGADADADAGRKADKALETVWGMERDSKIETAKEPKPEPESEGKVKDGAVNVYSPVFMLKKPEIVDAQGVVNTPKNVADLIVKETLEPLLGPGRQRIFHLKVADICCGSGNFLLSAYEYLINETLAAYQEAGLEQAVLEGKIYLGGRAEWETAASYRLSFGERRRILENCLYGVDIDTLAVEVARFSLLLKLVEECALEEMEQYAKQHRVKILPDLDRMVRCGNSLVDSSYLSFDTDFINKEPLFFKLRLFDWRREFPGISFDAIVGNPPYVRVQNLLHYTQEEYDYYKWHGSPYETGKSELLDKYYLFLERGFELLSEGGRLGYILPHRFLSIKTGKSLRKFLIKKRCVAKILHLGSQQVFAGRSTYTCLMFLEKREHKGFSFGIVPNLSELYTGKQPVLQTYYYQNLDDGPWSFVPDKVLAVMEGVRDRCEPLGSLARIFVGLQTSADSVYIIKGDEGEDGYVHVEKKDGGHFKVERALLRPCIYDLQLERYQKIEPNSFLVFPYYREGKRMKLYRLSEIRQRFPYGFAYLLTQKEKLKRRSVAGLSDENWHQFGRSQSLLRFDGSEHLLWPVLSKGANYVYDDGDITFTGGGNGPYYGLEKKEDVREHLFYLQAILNHSLMEAQVKSRASAFRGGYYSHGKQFVEQLPIYRICFDDERERGLHDAIVEQVKHLMEWKAQAKQCFGKEKRVVLERMADSGEQALSDMILELYRKENRDGKNLQLFGME